MNRLIRPAARPSPTAAAKLVVETDPHGTVMEAMVPTTRRRSMHWGRAGAGRKRASAACAGQRADLAQKQAFPVPTREAWKYLLYDLPDGRRTCVRTMLEISASGNRRIFLRLSRYEQRFESTGPCLPSQLVRRGLRPVLFWTNARGFRDRRPCCPSRQVFRAGLPGRLHTHD